MPVTTTDAAGTASLSLPIPASPAFLGASFYFQWIVRDTASTWGNVASFSAGLRILIGKS